MAWGCRTTQVSELNTETDHGDHPGQEIADRIERQQHPVDHLGFGQPPRRLLTFEINVEHDQHTANHEGTGQNRVHEGDVAQTRQIVGDGKVEGHEQQKMGAGDVDSLIVILEQKGGPGSLPRRKQMTLFADEQPAPVDHAPLADRMRPDTLDELLGQVQLVGPGRLLTQALAAERLPSMILWGPPGCGKTTVARLVAKQSHLPFAALSAVFAGVKEVRAVVERAKSLLATGAGGIILFMDEIHRFNKAQQDAFLPYGTVNK